MLILFEPQGWDKGLEVGGGDKEGEGEENGGEEGKEINGEKKAERDFPSFAIVQANGK